MRNVVSLAGLAAALVSACSPAPQSEIDEKSLRAETAAVAEQDSDKEMPVLDAQGNELDPELADAVREKMEEDRAALESGDEADAPSDDTAPATDVET